jgi:hypothetical protein
MKQMFSILLAAGLAAGPVYAGGKTVSGSATTTPVAVQSSALKFKISFSLSFSSDLTSAAVASLIAQYKRDIAGEFGVSEDRIEISAIQSQ